MINYTVKPGDIIGVIAVKYKTTIQILMNDNPFIPSNQALQPGWKLVIYEPEENAKRHSETAYDQIERAHRLKETLETNDYILSTPREPVYYRERLVLEGQIGFAKVLQDLPLFEVHANGYIKVIRQASKGEIFRVYEIAALKGEPVYLVDGYRWIPLNEKIQYEALSSRDLDGKIRISPPQHTFSIRALASSENSLAAASGVDASSVYLGSGPVQSLEKSGGGLSGAAVFERPNYKRPVMQLRNAKGETATIELRVLGFNASYSNSVLSSPTNAGWMVNVRAHNLPTLSISGFLLETKRTNEFHDFMSRYHQYLAAAKTDDYYGLGISTLFYKKTEYRGIVTGFNYTDQEAETFHRKYMMQMLVLKEKILSDSEVAGISTVVPRNNSDESTFRSDIWNMLANSITGETFGTDFAEK